MFQPSTRQVTRKRLTIVQPNFPKGVVTTTSSGRTPTNALTDMTNMDLVQDSIAKIRQSTVAYGPVALGTIIGIGTYTKVTAGVPANYQITMQVIAGVAKVVTNKDGGAWVTVGGSYNTTAWCQFTQSNSRVYISNGKDTMSYYDINLGTIVTYTALPAPTAPTLTLSASLTSGTPNITYYYGITANNATGETAVVSSAVGTVNKLRGSWVVGTDSITATGATVAGATSYNWYIATTGLTNDFQYLTTTSTPTLTDNGSTIINIFKGAPAGDSTKGPVLSYLISANAQLFGVGDPSAPYNMWYSAKGTHAGDFSPFAGGGYAYINYGGDALPTVVKSFHDGKGNPVITVLTRGIAGTGKFYHAQETSTSYGNTVIPYFQVYEANGQSGTISPMGVIEANGNVYYPTGDSFKSTGIAPNIVNTLSTNSISTAIDPDVRKLNLAAMSKCVGLSYNNRLYWAVANGTTSNNEIWVNDLARGGAWILRWTIPATYMYLYEDNTGTTHFCLLVNNVIVEFTSSVSSQDQGVAFSTRLAGVSYTGGTSGVEMAAMQSQRFKFLFPKGVIQINNYGVTEDLTGQQTLGGTTYTTSVSNTGYGQWDYSGIYDYASDVGYINSYAQATGIAVLEPDETLNELSWEIITNGSNTDYTLSSLTTLGTAIPSAYLGD